MLNRTLKWLGFGLLLSYASLAHSATFFFPDLKPSYAFAEVPKWLHDGRGSDGYVTVTSEVIPASSCIPLSNHSFWGGEKTQLVLSLTTRGFDSELDNREMPIATFDGRDNGSECATLSTLPLNVVPLALLGNFSGFNPGKLSLVLNVKSSSDSNQDLIGSAKLVLGAAAMVVTGGAAAAIGGIAATVSNPVLAEAQNRTNELMKGMASAKTPIALTWPKLRSGVRTIEIPVYRAEGRLSSASDSKIQQLQSDEKLEKTVLFTVRLSFSYQHSVFDPAATGAADLQSSDSVATAHVLNFQAWRSRPNFLQILNDASPSLLLAATQAEGRDLNHVCGAGLEKLKNLNLSQIDTAIVLKSFIDEAKGGAAWYGNPALVKSCFGQVPGVQAYLEPLYGASVPKFVIGDVQEGIGKAYKDWRDGVGPVLSGFRKAWSARERRLASLAAFNGGQDIRVTFSPEVSPWRGAGSADEVNGAAYPGLESLTGQDIKTIGCFIYQDPAHLVPGNWAAYFAVENSRHQFWLAEAKFPAEGAAKISALHFSELTMDWANYFESYRYPGGDCGGMLERLRTQGGSNPFSSGVVAPQQ